MIFFEWKPSLRKKSGCAYKLPLPLKWGLFIHEVRGDAERSPAICEYLENKVTIIFSKLNIL